MPGNSPRSPLRKGEETLAGLHASSSREESGGDLEVGLPATGPSRADNASSIPLEGEAAGASCWTTWLGRMPYGEAWELQRRLAAARAEGRIPDLLLLVEHPPTFTFGRRTRKEHFLVSSEGMERAGACVVPVDRGGDVTFHGPGQLVGYPILSIRKRPGSVSRYLRDLEEVLIRALAEFGVAAGREPGLTGVWVEAGKIAAIGVKIDVRGVTTHGFALNVATDLDFFGMIVPCGIGDRAVTSLDRVPGRPAVMDEVRASVVRAFGRVFERDMREVAPETLRRAGEDGHD